MSLKASSEPFLKFDSCCSAKFRLRKRAPQLLECVPPRRLYCHALKGRHSKQTLATSLSPRNRYISPVGRVAWRAPDLLHTPGVGALLNA